MTRRSATAVVLHHGQQVAARDEGAEVTCLLRNALPFDQVQTCRLRRAHKEYGTALGVTVSGATQDEGQVQVSIRDAFDQACEALRAYVLRVSAHARKSDPASTELAETLLRPLASWQSPPVRTSPADEPEPTPPDSTTKPSMPDAPAKPVAPSQS